jgi:hypothetical protein
MRAKEAQKKELAEADAEWNGVFSVLAHAPVDGVDIKALKTK